MSLNSFPHVDLAKGEIARFEQFLLLSLCFQKGFCCRGVRESVYMRKGVKGTVLYICVKQNKAITLYFDYYFNPFLYANILHICSR